MRTPDAFAAYHAQLVETAYDCVDRLVINCSYPLGQVGSSFRTSWRQWQGDDSALSGEALRQAVGDLARRLKLHCQRQGILWIKCGAGELKYQIARKHRPKDPASVGVFAVGVGRAPAPLWVVRRNGRGQITELRRTEQWPYVQHYYFQIIDPEWGHLVVRLCGHAPWGAQVMVNGHEWVEGQARAQKVRQAKAGNCFIEGSNYRAVDRLAGTLSGPELGPRVAELCVRWLYSACLCFALPLTEQERIGFEYQYWIWQLEYSRDFPFKAARVLEEVFQKLIDRTRAPLDTKSLETIFGRRHRQPTKPFMWSST